MSYESNIFNIDTFFEESASKRGWDNKEQLAKILSILESMNHQQLVRLCKLPSIGIHFNGDDWESMVPDDQIICALINDADSKLLESALEEIG